MRFCGAVSRCGCCCGDGRARGCAAWERHRSKGGCGRGRAGAACGRAADRCGKATIICKASRCTRLACEDRAQMPAWLRGPLGLVPRAHARVAAGVEPGRLALRGRACPLDHSRWGGPHTAATTAAAASAGPWQVCSYCLGAGARRARVAVAVPVCGSACVAACCCCC